MQASYPAVEAEKSERGGEGICPPGNVNHGCALYWMNCPHERRKSDRRFAQLISRPEQAEQFVGEKQKGDGGREMTKNVGEMKNSGAKRERPIFHGVGQALDWPVKTRGRRVGKKKMLKSFG